MKEPQEANPAKRLAEEITEEILDDGSMPVQTGRLVLAVVEKLLARQRADRDAIGNDLSKDHIFWALFDDGARYGPEKRECGSCGASAITIATRAPSGTHYESICRHCYDKLVDAAFREDRP